MTAVNPTPPNATPERDQRPYEPPMEEILASIRRIIADDQSLPGRQEPPAPVEPLVAETRAPELEPTTIHVLRPAPAADVEPVPAIADRAAHAPETLHPAPEALRDHEITRTPTPPSFVAHGAIAPQYATPQGPVSASATPPTATPDDIYSSFDGEHVAGPIAQPIDLGPHPRHDAPVDDDSAFQPVYQPEFASLHDEPLGRHEPTPFEPTSVEPTSLFSATTNQSLASAFNTLAASRLADNSDDLLSMSREMIRPLLKTWLDENLPSMVERLVRAEIERVARGGR